MKLIIEYYLPDVKLKKKREYFIDELNQKQGASVEYFSDGTKMYETKFVDNKEHGKLVHYNKDGSIKQTGEYILGKRHGLWITDEKKTFYIDGKQCEEDDLKSYSIIKRFNK